MSMVACWIMLGLFFDESGSGRIWKSCVATKMLFCPYCRGWFNFAKSELESSVQRIVLHMQGSTEYRHIAVLAMCLWQAQHSACYNQRICERSGTCSHEYNQWCAFRLCGLGFFHYRQFMDVCTIGSAYLLLSLQNSRREEPWAWWVQFSRLFDIKNWPKSPSNMSQDLEYIYTDSWRYPLRFLCTLAGFPANYSFIVVQDL